MRRSLCALLLLFLPSLALAAPTISPIPPLADGGFTNGNVRVRIEGTGELSATVNGQEMVPENPAVRANSAIFHRADVPLTPFDFEHGDPNDPNDTNVITIVANDEAGTPTTKVFDLVKYDPVAPTVTVNEPDPGTPNFTTGHTFVHFAGMMSDNDPNTAFALLVGGFPLTDFSLDPSGVFGIDVDLSEGDNTIVARGLDRSANVTSVTFVVTRTRVCGAVPTLTAGVGETPKTYNVSRLDDLPLASDATDPNGPCTVRREFREDPGDPLDPNDPNHVVKTPTSIPVCSLRAAIQLANLHPGPDTIQLFPGRVVLTRTGGREDDAARGDLDIKGDLRIIGQGRDSAVIDGSKLGDRVFDVAPGVKLQLINLTVTGGHTPKPDKNDPNSTVENGGCVRSRGGQVRVNNVAMLSCDSDQDGGAFALEDGNALVTCGLFARSQAKRDGGGIFSRGGLLQLENSTLSLNTAGNRGGAVSISGDEGTLAIPLFNDTLSQNKAKVAGGAFDLGPTVEATMNNMTFANNAAKAGTSISSTGSATATIANSILGDSAKSSCDPNSPEPVVSQGGNIERGDTCHLQAPPTDLANTDPQLEKLANNAGLPTHRLKQTSPAIDFAGVETKCEDVDVREVERGDWPGNGNGPNGNADPPFCDAGALELRAP